MNLSIFGWTLLAQISRWERLGDGLHRGRGRVDLADLLPWAIGLGVVGIGVAVAVAVVKQNDFSKPCDDPNKLFRELCRAHQLDRASGRLLRQLAEAFQLEQPAEIFLSPVAFQPDVLPQSLRGEQQHVGELRERLF